MVSKIRVSTLTLAQPLSPAVVSTVQLRRRCHIPDETPLSSDCGLRSSCSCQSNPPNENPSPPTLHLQLWSSGCLSLSLSPLLDCIMPPGSKKSSASSNSTSTMHNTAAVQVGTGATTPALEILTSTPLTVASPSTRASASGPPSAKQRRVRGPTRGKRIRRIIAENKGERISVFLANCHSSPG